VSCVRDAEAIIQCIVNVLNKKKWKGLHHQRRIILLMMDVIYTFSIKSYIWITRKALAMK